MALDPHSQFLEHALRLHLAPHKLLNWHSLLTLLQSAPAAFPSAATRRAQATLRHLSASDDATVQEHLPGEYIRFPNSCTIGRRRELLQSMTAWEFRHLVPDEVMRAFRNPQQIVQLRSFAASRRFIAQRMLSLGVDGGWNIEVGCGDGELAEMLIVQNVSGNTTVIDLSQDCIQAVQARLMLSAPQQTNVEFIWGDVRCMTELDAAMYDTVICCHVLELIPRAHLLLALRNLHRLIRPGGRLLLAAVVNQALDPPPQTEFFSEPSEEHVRGPLVEHSRSLTSRFVDRVTAGPLNALLGHGFREVPNLLPLLQSLFPSVQVQPLVRELGTVFECTIVPPPAAEEGDIPQPVVHPRASALDNYLQPRYPLQIPGQPAAIPRVTTSPAEVQGLSQRLATMLTARRAS
eukprot:TRINITY_DN9711_c0_g1_i1.p1 TRINITY_DN9711_c0_g1~~TRINITY_DN9711_c0_g1_i1.p1  ORF type:complete len:413 (+),score=68.51 TRINITY_DN9711_c0_g1_i1:26-1240(+)